LKGEPALGAWPEMGDGKADDVVEPACSEAVD